jgi:hypothetical protein
VEISQWQVIVREAATVGIRNGCAKPECIRDVTAPDLSCHRTLPSLTRPCQRVRVIHGQSGFTGRGNVDYAVISILLSLGSSTYGAPGPELRSTAEISLCRSWRQRVLRT